MLSKFKRSAAAIVALTAMLALTARPVAAQQAPVAEKQLKARQVAPAVTVVTTEDPNAERTREQLMQLLEKYPPSLGRVLKLDPSLLSNADYLATYPALSSFLTQHPDVARNPAYYLERIRTGTEYRDDRSEAYRMWGDVLGWIGDGRLKLLAPLLPYDGIDPDTVKFLGTGLWDEAGLGVEPALNGGWYAAPAPERRATFQSRYLALYKQQPPRLATFGYDATALAVALAKAAPDGGYSPETLTNPSGFSGLAGLFRLNPDGMTQRGLAVLEVQRGVPVVIDPAPADFQALGQ